jgi:hypothetical protein
MKKLIGPALWMAFFLLQLLPVVSQAKITVNHNETLLS